MLDDPGAASRQGNYQAALLAANPGRIFVVQGRYQRKTVTCQNCRSTWVSYEEKETDVSIASALIADAALGSAEAALVISADSDLAPGIRTAKVVAPKMFVTAAFPPRRYSAELAALMPASFHIGAAKIRAAQLPQTVVDRSTGRRYVRPAKWR